MAVTTYELVGLGGLSQVGVPGFDPKGFAADAFIHLGNERYANSALSRYIATSSDVIAPLTLLSRTSNESVSKKGTPTIKRLRGVTEVSYPVLRTDAEGIETLIPNGYTSYVGFTALLGLSITIDDRIQALDNAYIKQRNALVLQKLAHGVAEAY